MYKTLMAVIFLFVSGVIPTQKENTQEGEKLYRLWFVLDLNGSMNSAFCRCKVAQIKDATRYNFVETR